MLFLSTFSFEKIFFNFFLNVEYTKKKKNHNEIEESCTHTHTHTHNIKRCSQNIITTNRNDEHISFRCKVPSLVLYLQVLIRHTHIFSLEIIKMQEENDFFKTSENNNNNNNLQLDTSFPFFTRNF